MRKLYFLLLLFSSMAFAQPAINNPSNYVTCGVAGVGTFDLTTKIPEVLGSLDPALYSESYYLGFNEAFMDTNPISNPTAYTNSSVIQQTIYIRVSEIANPALFSITSLTLIVNNAPPLPTTILDLFVDDTPYDGVASFDLTLNNAALVNNDTNVSVSYFLSQMDAQNGTNSIAAPTSFIGSDGQVVWARLDNNANGCFSTTSFTLHVVNPLDIVNIPDANFKAKLIGTNCADFNNDGVFDGDADTNNDSQIQTSEALAVKRLQLNNTALPSPDAISSLVGLEAFTNLMDLNAELNTIGSFNFALPSLHTLSIGHNNLTAVDLTGFPNLQVLYCSQNSITSLNLNATPNLISLACDYNPITALDLSSLTNLTGLSARYNNLSTIDLSHNTLLTSVQLDGNVMALNVSNLVNLQSLGCASMGLTTIDLSNNVNLTTLSMNSNNFTALSLPSLPLLSTLFCAQSTTLTSLNVNLCPSLSYFSCVNNQNLTHLFMKNGVAAFTNLDLAQNNNLQFLCADDFNVDGLITNLNFLGIHGVNVCSYCTFTPGGNYNTITGHVTFDSDNNGCDANDVSEPNIRVDINDGTNTGAAFNTTTGNYSFFTEAGFFTLTPNIENAAWFTITPQSDTVYYPDNNNHSTTKDFCLAPVGTHQDLEVVLMPLTTARPGFNAIYKIVYRNKGNTIMAPGAAGISLNYNANVLTYLSSTQSVALIGTNSLSFDYPLLLPFASGSIEVTFHLNAPTDTPPVIIGDVLQFSTVISPLINDDNSTDNTFNFSQTVVGSYDPNEIICLEGAMEDPSQIGQYLHYAVNFENTGNYQAENIVVKELIDLNMYDLNSLQVLNSSDNVATKITNNTVEFIFQNINLDSGGHGNILLKIKSLNTLQQGDMVSKKANIYFDYNAPITTNIASTVFQALSNQSFPTDTSVGISPNPSKNIVRIKSNNNITSVQLFDVQGRILQTQLSNQSEVVLDIATQNAGVYFLKITTDKGSKVEKIVKE